MKLPLGRPLAYERFPFVQAARSPVRAPVPRDVLGERVGPGRAALIPDFDALRSATFHPGRVHPRLRGFYERPEPHHMRVEWLRWEPWAEPLAFAYLPLARRVGNLCIPRLVDGGARMSSSVQELFLHDGGSSRRWVRTLSGTSRVFYIAALRTWVDEHGQASYWSLAFPFPGINLMVLLRLRNVDDGIEVSSRADELTGTYVIVPGRRVFVALPGPPTHEVLRFWVEGEAVAGAHEDFLGGRRAFALRYRIERALCEQRPAVTVQAAGPEPG
ncbi:MAG: hypothetical protein K8M05_29010 [Deltaproteobacteria bacterium]|nr:hypothetical protein [Kofleriaceae bacterium]